MSDFTQNTAMDCGSAGNILEIKELVQSYRRGDRVIRGMDLEIGSGKIVGLLGPNGCGKSTLMKLIAGLLVADSGEIFICGEKRSEKSNALISYLPDRPAFSMNMKSFEILDYYEDFFADFDRELADKMLEDLGIDQTKKLRYLSKGTRDKVQLVLTMARRAKLYLLDEPMAGIDPAAREYVIRTIIGNYNPDAAVIITTHLIADIESMLDEYIFMGFGGKILMQGTVDSVREERGQSLDQAFREVFRC